jgi:hypothetical protein
MELFYPKHRMTISDMARICNHVSREEVGERDREGLRDQPHSGLPTTCDQNRSIGYIVNHVFGISMQCDKDE